MKHTKGLRRLRTADPSKRTAAQMHRDAIRATVGRTRTAWSTYPAAWTLPALTLALGVHEDQFRQDLAAFHIDHRRVSYLALDRLRWAWRRAVLDRQGWGVLTEFVEKRLPYWISLSGPMPADFIWIEPEAPGPIYIARPVTDPSSPRLQPNRERIAGTAAERAAFLDLTAPLDAAEQADAQLGWAQHSAAVLAVLGGLDDDVVRLRLAARLHALTAGRIDGAEWMETLEQMRRLRRLRRA